MQNGPIFGSTKVTKVDKFDSYDEIITRKLVYNQFRDYLCDVILEHLKKTYSKAKLAKNEQFFCEKKLFSTNQESYQHVSGTGTSK